MDLSQLSAWIVGDGTVGMEAQSLGLARAIGLQPALKRIRVRAPWRFLPPSLWLDPLGRLQADGDRLEPPWPEVVIGTGRQAAALSLAIQRASAGRCFTVQMHDPKLPPERFGVVVAPEHDRLRGPNVVVVTGSMHGVTAPVLEAAADRFRAGFAPLPRPLVAVLVGGSNGRYRLDPPTTRRLAQDLIGLQRQGYGIALTPSRRTGEANEIALRETLAGSGAFIWDGSGENPYFGLLALADAILVTADSVNMVSEALATGKPVHVLDLPGRPGKFQRFHQSLVERGLTRPFRGRIETWTYPPPDETARVAALVRERILSHFAQQRPGLAD
ncbi:MAG: mitochondrial fission ELM1 family protein [Proteobacteria bacterium]|nr:mitochondrial fission ELM1 family protein [Pseudomonadota bacterium]MBI3497405.1 mitochondrial fission ELM1 family protein [Pseudomonadota bacterium]